MKEYKYKFLQNLQKQYSIEKSLKLRYDYNRNIRIYVGYFKTAPRAAGTALLAKSTSAANMSAILGYYPKKCCKFKEKRKRFFTVP